MEYDSIPGRLLLIMMVDMGRIHTKFAVPDGFETVPTTMWWIFFFSRLTRLIPPGMWKCIMTFIKAQLHQD
jgi:hypothetical protein